MDAIPKETAIPAGIMKASNNVSVTINYNGDFLIGPEGAHLNVSGISGLATKTSYIMFLLKAIQYKLKNNVAFIVLNVKGDDLLHIDKPNYEITPSQKKIWDEIGIPCEPFENVKYLYPYSKDKEKFHTNTANNIDDLHDQFDENIASNFVYTYEHDINKVDLLFTNIDDPNWTIESILNYINTNYEFDDDLSWTEFKKKLRDHTQTGGNGRGGSRNQEIPVQSWRRFSRLINNSINDPVFVNDKSDSPEKHQVYLEDEIKNIIGGEVKVVDISGLTEQLQCLVFGDVIQAVYALKHGDYDDTERVTKKPIPKKIIIFVDELNKYAPAGSGKHSPLLANLLDITERGRSEGVILFAAEQFRSAVHERIKGNSGTNVYGRTNAIEISKPDYRYVPKVYSNMMTRLSKGDLIIQHPVFKTMLKIEFPYPSYDQGGTR